MPLNAAGDLEFSLSQGGPIAVGNVKGEAGVSVTGANLNAAGDLEFTLSEGDPLVVGNVKGSLGKTV